MLSRRFNHRLPPPRHVAGRNDLDHGHDAVAADVMDDDRFLLAQIKVGRGLLKQLRLGPQHGGDAPTVRHIIGGIVGTFEREDIGAKPGGLLLRPTVIGRWQEFEQRAISSIQE